MNKSYLKVVLVCFVCINLKWVVHLLSRLNRTHDQSPFYIYITPISRIRNLGCFWIRRCWSCICVILSGVKLYMRFKKLCLYYHQFFNNSHLYDFIIRFIYIDNFNIHYVVVISRYIPVDKNIFCHENCFIF